MSLLLDALKKAAEQKAQKSKQEQQPESSTSDVTEVYEAPETAAELEARADQARSRRDPADETGLEYDEETRTRAADPSRQMQTGEDETIVFSDDDVSDFLDGPRYAERRPDDETDLSAPPRDDATELRLRPPRDEETDLSRISDDATDLGRVDETEFPSAHEDETVFPPPRVDETEFPSAHEDETVFPPPRVDETEIITTTSYADQTEVDRSPPPARELDSAGAYERDETTEMQTQASAIDDGTESTWLGEDGTETESGSIDDTDISVPTRTVSDINSGIAGSDRGSEDTDVSHTVATSDSDTTEGVPDEDLSLLLVEHDKTGRTETSVTDPQLLSDQMSALQGDNDLALVETTRHRPPPADSTVTERSSTATTRSADTVTGEGTTRRAESTSTATTGATTRTYAPDNYDRTLMKLPNEDASRLFAGMKSDSDVVMTPDYAKKVFQSKSSAQRLQHYKLYAGIAFAILLGIGVYGLFEMQAESTRIESSLQPLKRDPMPGIIRPEPTQPVGITLPPVGVDEKTIELIESAGEVSDPGTVEQAAAEQGVIAAETESVAADTSATRAAPAPTPRAAAASGTTSAPGAVISGEIGTDARGAAASASSLEIRSSSRISDRDRWLREAYDAYVAGDDKRALEGYGRVLEVDPRNRNALLARAAINVQNGEAAAAIADYQALLLANPKDSLAMASLLTIANYSPQEAETQIKLMLRDEPDSPYLNFALANAYGAQNRWQEAQAHYFTALQNNPDDPNYAYNLAVSLEHIARPKVAIAFYQRALDNFDKGLATFSKDVVDQRLETLRKL